MNTRGGIGQYLESVDFGTTSACLLGTWSDGCSYNVVRLGDIQTLPSDDNDIWYS